MDGAIPQAWVLDQMKPGKGKVELSTSYLSQLPAHKHNVTSRLELSEPQLEQPLPPHIPCHSV